MKGFNAPGRFSRSPESVKKSIRTETTRPGVSFGFGTELQSNGRAAAAKAGAGPEWTTTRFGGGKGRGECAIFTKNATRLIVHTELLQLTKGGGKGRFVNPIYAPVVIAGAPSGRVTLFTTCHLPAHLETLWRAIPLPTRVKFKRLAKRPNLSPVIATYLEAFDAWKRGVMDLAAEHHVDDIVVGADWNLSSFAKWVRQFVRASWPGLRIAHTKGPDLGKRNVGWLLTSMDLVSSSVHSTPASDHRVGRFELRHVNAPRVHPQPVKPPDPFQRVTYNGALMDQKTKTFLQCCEKDLGYSLTVLQGCYNPGGVAASGGTHDGGGVVDLAPFDFERKVKTARKRGGFYWHRLPIPGVWGEHIHGGIRNHGALSSSARRQQVDYDAHPARDGLARHSLDPTWHPSPPVGFDYVPAWHEING